MSLMAATMNANPGLPTDYDSDDDESIYTAVTAPSFVGSNATSLTSWESEVRSESPAPSVWSMTSSMREQIFKTEYGRNLNNYSEVYQLPADEDELLRLDKQHVMFKEVMGKYPPPMNAIMADDVPGERTACLDLGCGSGSWILDVAHDFPNCSAVAVDLVPMQADRMPPNLRSEVDDINLGLEHFYGDFNVVHARLVSSGVRDYVGLIDQIARVLKPGGLLDLMEFDFRVYALDKKPYPLNLSVLESPWLPRWMAFANKAARDRGGDVDAANYLQQWTEDHPSFRDVVYREFWIQTSPWNQGKDEESKRQNQFGKVMRDDIKEFLKSGRPLLLNSGLPVSVVDELQEKSRLELDEGRVPGYIRCQYVYAIRRP